MVPSVHFEDAPSMPSFDKKRGISVPWNFDPKHFALYAPAIESGKISWLFNWEMWKPKGIPPKITYVPQCRTAKEVDQIKPRLTRFLNDEQAQHFMGFNEPEIDAQANLSVSEAVELWKQYVLPMKKSCPGVRIGAPSISNGRHGLPWLVSFISDLGGIQDSGIDHIVLHFYGPSIQVFKDYVQEVDDAFGLPIWVTELACTNWDTKTPISEKDVLQFMKEAVDFLEKTEFIEKYAWFGAMEDVGEGVGRANGLQKGTELTAAGRLYCSL